MAKVQKRTMAEACSSGRGQKSWATQPALNGKQERKFAADWTEEDARPSWPNAFWPRTRPTAVRQRWPGVRPYLQAKARKRSIADADADEMSAVRHVEIRAGTEGRVPAPGAFKKRKPH